MSTSSALGADVSSFLGSLSPGQFLGLTNRLSASNEVKALGVLDSMEIGDAAALSGQLSGIPNLPATVMTYVNEAIEAATSTPPDAAGFKAAMTNAKVQLQQAAVSGW